MKRLVRDVFHISGVVVRNTSERLLRIMVNQRSLPVRGPSGQKKRWGGSCEPPPMTLDAEQFTRR
jgi:hypothetical protein